MFYKIAKKYSVVLVVLLAIVAGLFVVGCSTSEGVAALTGLDYKATVLDYEFAGYEQTGGRVKVVEQLSFDIKATPQGPVRELWRALPEYSEDGVKVGYSVTSVKQISIDSQSAYKELDNSGRLYWDSEFDNPNFASQLADKWFHSPGPYNEYDLWESVMIYPYLTKDCTVVYEIEYEQYNASRRYADASQLYVTLYQDEQIKALNFINAQILFKNEQMPSEGNYESWAFGTNAHKLEVQQSTTKNDGYNTFYFELSKEQLKFKKYNQFVEFGLIAYGDDKHAFVQYASVNDYYDTNQLDWLMDEYTKFAALPTTYEAIKVLIVVASLLFFAFFGILMLVLDRAIRKSNGFARRHAVPLYPQIPSNIDISFARELVFCKIGNRELGDREFGANLLSLIKKGYFELVKIDQSKEWAFGNTKIIQKPHPLNGVDKFDSETGQPLQNPSNMTPVEVHYYALLCRHTNNQECSLKDLKSNMIIDFEYTNSFMQNAKNSIIDIGMNGGYFGKQKYKKPKMAASIVGWSLMLAGAIFMLVSNLIAYRTRLDLAFGAFFVFGGGTMFWGFVLVGNSTQYVALTEFGEQEYKKWFGFYKFLKRQKFESVQRNLDIGVWENFLIYAVAFGLSKRTIKKLTIKVSQHGSHQRKSALSDPLFGSMMYFRILTPFRMVRPYRHHYYGNNYRNRWRGGGFGGGGG